MDFIRTDPRGEEYRNLDWSHEYDLARNGDPPDTQSALYPTLQGCGQRERMAGQTEVGEGMI